MVASVVRQIVQSPFGGVPDIWLDWRVNSTIWTEVSVISVGRDQVHLTQQGMRILGDLLGKEVAGCMERVRAEQQLLK
ncbi:hypothetical protein PR048_007107 [Dryococelus australis]|uniref:SGNH hydrolase-type esterase domain-containing protein n=1 Tax=Dryococelus australis TaxID=614101 RepID=A0ABQ9ICP3_9NEOP|nr:hypothetical protein PR048_007107 [Dryococelus australis]